MYHNSLDSRTRRAVAEGGFLINIQNMTVVAADNEYLNSVVSKAFRMNGMANEVHLRKL